VEVMNACNYVKRGCRRLIWSTAADNDILASRDVPVRNFSSFFAGEPLILAHDHGQDMIATSSALSKRDLA
jgi:hypothetical protein